jgi:hypothetical protein
VEELRSHLQLRTSTWSWYDEEPLHSADGGWGAQWKRKLCDDALPEHARHAQSNIASRLGEALGASSLGTAPPRANRNVGQTVAAAPGAAAEAPPPGPVDDRGHVEGHHVQRLEQDLQGYRGPQLRLELHVQALENHNQLAGAPAAPGGAAGSSSGTVESASSGRRMPYDSDSHGTD